MDEVTLEMWRVHVRETYVGSRNETGGAAEESNPATGGCHAPVRSTIQDMIHLIARFHQEWFHSLDTLEIDLQRFAALYQLNPEEAHQVQRAIEALYREE